LRKRLIIKDKQQELKIFNRHIIVAGILCVVLTLALIARLVYLQVYLHTRYVTLSYQNQVSIIPIEPNRGLIFDRHGVLLAENIPIFNLEMLPEQVPDIKSSLSELKKIIPVNDEDIIKQLKTHRRTEPVTLLSRLNEQQVAEFMVNQYHFPGISVNAQLLRYYPLGSSLVHVLGYVGRINEKELNQVNAVNYSATNFIGKVGIEKYYEDMLHGTVGYQEVEADANGHIVRVLNHVPPVPGQNLVLSIDSRLQMLAGQALNNVSGAIVAIEPSTGAVLALVSNPGYDPNLFVQGISTKDFQALHDSSKQPLYNRTIRGQYPLGSTIKPFLGLLGLESGVITPQYSLLDPGWYKLQTSSHLYRDWRRDGHGWVNITSAIMQSCDTYFYQLAFKLGIDRIDDILTQFNFGKLTGIDMSEELPGLVPSPAWKRRTHGSSWFPGDTLISGIGQGFMLTTPLQLAVATSILANHGQGYQPSLLLYSQTYQGKRHPHIPVPLPTINMQPNTWQVILNAMQEVVKNPQGTGHRLGKDLTYTMAAKTGTVQVFSLKENQKDISDTLPEQLRDHSLFIAFAPADNPRIAVAVVAEHSTAAGAIARKVIDYYLQQEPS
jgi:penicillin-binding protein 2